jgi:AcrR family transcriptional regulator
MPGSASPPRRPGRPARLSHEAVVAAAEAIVAAEGVEALTMRRLAERLGSSPMALYRHVGGKDELLVALLERAAREVPRPPLPADPRERLRLCWTLLHDGLVERPWAVPLLAAGDRQGPSILWLIDAILAAFIDAGLSERQAGVAYRAVWHFTVGELTVRDALERRNREAGRTPRALVGLPPVRAEELPAFAALAPHWQELRERDWYADGLHALVEGLLTRPPSV